MGTAVIEQFNKYINKSVNLKKNNSREQEKKFLMTKNSKKHVNWQNQEVLKK